MAEIAGLVGLMSAFHSTEEAGDDEKNMMRLMATLPMMAIWNYKKGLGQDVNQPDTSLDYCATFLQLMFAKPGEAYTVDPVVSKALNKLLILHADHEQNCSTSTVRLVGSSQANVLHRYLLEFKHFLDLYMGVQTKKLSRCWRQLKPMEEIQISI